MKICNELHIKSNGFGRPEEISMSIRVGGSWVLLRDGEIMYVLPPSFTLKGPLGCDSATTRNIFVSNQPAETRLIFYMVTA